MSTPSKQDGASDSHICQRCHQPLLLDPSVQNLSPSNYSLITSALPSSYPSSSHLPAAAKLASLPPLSQPGARVWAESNHLSVPGPSYSASGSGSNSRSVAESFILLSGSALMPPPSQPPQVSSSQPNASSHQTKEAFSHPHNQNLVTQLHSILSANTPISHPLCTECTALLSTELQKMAEELTKERDAYIAFEQSIQRNREKQRDAPLRQRQREPGARGNAEIEGQGTRPDEGDIEGTEEEWEELKTRKKELEEEEEQLIVVLKEKEEELNEVRVQEERVKRDEEQVDKEETEYLLSHAALSTELSHLSSSLSTAQTHLLLSRSLLSHLESTNVYNDAFQIGHVPLDPSSSSTITVGTINGLRLGGRPTVEWEEINAAWGLVALCLDRVADKVGCTFQTYKIVPLGSYSKVEELPPSKGSYELYASSDLSPARLLQNRRFNHAMVAVLDCLRQLVEFGRREGKEWAMGGFEIHKDKISSYSIKLPGISSMPLSLPSMSIMGLGSSSIGTSNSSTNANTASSSGGSGGGAAGKTTDSTAEETWTRACRAVLMLLKRVLRVESAERISVGGSSGAGAAVGVGVGADGASKSGTGVGSSKRSGTSTGLGR